MSLRFQLIRLNNERFSIPELLFYPSDVGIQEMGITEAIVHSINKCPEETRPHLYRYQYWNYLKFVLILEM